VTVSQNENLTDALSRELFGVDLEGLEEHSWNDRVIAKWRELSNKGMQAEEQILLMKKYSPPESL